MNKSKQRLVQVLHKLNDEGQLAVGKTFEFQSGAAYTVQEDGSLRSNKVKLSKAERKQRKRAALK